MSEALVTTTHCFDDKLSTTCITTVTMGAPSVNSQFETIESNGNATRNGDIIKTAECIKNAINNNVYTDTAALLSTESAPLELELILNKASLSLSSLSSRSSFQKGSDESLGGSPSGHTRSPPPDGGWGWVIVFASFMISLISDGISLSSGTIFVELSDYFEESKSKTSWVLSIILSMPLLAGPIASYLTDRYGCRIMCIIGALLASSGFVISFASNSLALLYLTFALSGFGLALCLVTSVVIIPYYFEKKRGLATGLSVCGTGIGTFVFPPLVSYLLENYAWRGTFLILAGFFLNIAVFGSLMRDLDPRETKDVASSSSHSDDEESRDLQLSSGLKDEFGNLEYMNPRLCNSLLQLPTYLQRENITNLMYGVNRDQYETIEGQGGDLTKDLWLAKFMQEPHINCSPQSPPPPALINTKVQIKSPGSNEQAVVSIQDSSSPKLQPKRSQKWSRQSGGGGGGWGLAKSLTHNTEYLKKLRLQRGSLTYRGAMLNIPRYKICTSSCPDIYRNSNMTISDQRKRYQFLHDLKEVFLDMVDLSIFRNVRFAFFCFSNFILYACIDIPYIYLQDYAITLGFEKEAASFLISILGILNTLGMVIVGYFGDKRYVDSALLYMAFVLVCGLSMAVIPWLSQYAIIATTSAIYGFTISANYTLMSVIVVNLISLDHFTSAYGMLLLIQGIASLVGPPIAGYFYDLYGTYNLTFLATGVSIVLSGLLVFPVVKSYPYCWKSKTQEAKSSNEGKMKGEPILSPTSKEEFPRQMERVRFKEPETLIRPNSSPPECNNAIARL